MKSMKTLEGNQAIDYLDRLTTTLPNEDDMQTANIPQGLLLLTILKLEKEFLRTRLDNPEDAYILVDAHGFPSLPIILAHLGHALKWYENLSHHRRELAANWLDAVINLNNNQFSNASAKIFDNPAENNHPLVALLKSQPDDRLDYLKKVSNDPENSRNNLPIFNLVDFPGILLIKNDGTPFAPLTDKEDYTFERGVKTLVPRAWFLKFIDAPQLNQNFPGGTQDNPLASRNSSTTVPRTPTVIVGQVTTSDNDKNHQRGDLIIKQTYAPRVKLYYDYNGDRYFTDKSERSTQIMSENRQSGVVDQIEEFSGLDQVFLTAFLSLDLTQVPDNTIDTVLRTLPQLANKTYKIRDLANRMTKHDNGVTDQEARNQFEGLKKLLSSIDDTASQKALHLAAAKILSATRDEIKPPNSNHSGDSQIPEKANKQSFLQSLFSAKS